MNKINTVNSNAYDLINGMLICRKCGNDICHLSDCVDCGKIAFICKCNSFGSVEINNNTLEDADPRHAILKDNYIVCPCCGSTLLILNPNDYINIAFRLKCSCGYSCNTLKDFSSINKRLYEY